ncbi:ISWI chromatin-remodeling complex ATPase ISW2 [Melanomma pulvis-pyrius CBS 109.77]|uniref:ISWI chromatin-remodeling complex ATPase ISW2 n=1 Tax=Melanomma pulvis-pyrius CBS 109.77 TaxID=1314802 RepID=A0A6A6X3F3_9PLEO|nr:ISWI chromatin-remodeling complex ATPase ISW2 [Melanomma pulvis-pyrius CBS 109.77]
MDRRRVSVNTTLPTTPKRKGGALESLLAQFGSQSSAESATKTRRTSSYNSPKRELPAADVAAPNDVTKHAPTPPAFTHNLSEYPANSSLDDLPELPATSSTLPTRDAELPKVSTLLAPPSPKQTSSFIRIDSSEDELAKAPKASFQRLTRSNAGDAEVLKMENRKKDRADGPRRSTRGNKGNILESDTVQHQASTEMKRKAPPRMKLNTARTRLRGEIAAQSKAKANNFLVANKESFLPLLPPHNHISKLVTSNKTGPIVEYEELTEQPEGVTATMKPYQLSGLSFLVHLYNNGFSGILGDEMGLGKTLQTLSLFQYLEEQDRKTGISSEELRPYLVICPLSVLRSWVSEAQRWVPQLKVLQFHGPVNERDRLKRVALGMEDTHGNETRQSKARKASRKAGLGVSKLPTDESSDGSYKIIVTTYETYQAEQSWFKHSFVWRYVVLDEGHKIKSNVTQISASLRTISAEYRLILTGTPLQNNLVEMWALLAWLYPDVFTENTETLFKESFDLNRGKVNTQTMNDARSLLELIMLRRMKDSPGVDLNLPEKEEVLLYVPLTPMQRFWYTRLLTRVDDAILNDLFADGKSKEKDALRKEKREEEMWAKMEELDKKTATAVGPEKAGEWEETAEIMRQAIEKEQASNEPKSAWKKLMNLVMQLRKCCSHPYLLPGAIPDPYYLGEHVIRASGKFILLEKLLKHTIYEKGKKVLIFSQFTNTLDCCEDLLTLISDHGKGFKFLRLDGSTASARRNLNIRMLNDPNSEYKVMLLSTRAGGLGINLTSAEDVIFLDEDWNPQITLQAEARAHRIGQTKKVTIYKLCTQGTVEEQMLGRIRKKLYLSTKITESMRTVHGEIPKAKGRPSNDEDMPVMNTSQLKNLVRRGAQTLSHPEINVTEMLSWDLDTMLQKCRDKPADPKANPEILTSEVDEEKWLSVMERVECAVFDGKRYQRQIETSGSANPNILPTSISREDRRKGKNTTVMINGFAISKESLNCADWEAVPTFAGKDPRLAEVKREKRREVQHEEHCLVCFDDSEAGHMVNCKSCPRAYHFDCLEPEFQSKVRGFSGFFCPQHQCADCGKKTTDAGGLIYRCRFCEHGYCEDCLQWGKEELVGDNLPEFEMLGEGPTAGGFYIKCPRCINSVEEDEEKKEWMEGLEQTYNDQHEAWITAQEEQERLIEIEQDALRKDKESAKANGELPRVTGKGLIHSRYIPLDDEVESPPALTDTSLLTPAPGDSGVSSPKLAGGPKGPGLLANGHASREETVAKGKKRIEPDDHFGESREEKRMRLDNMAWEMDNDPLIMAFTNKGI